MGKNSFLMFRNLLFNETEVRSIKALRCQHWSTPIRENSPEFPQCLNTQTHITISQLVKYIPKVPSSVSKKHINPLFLKSLLPARDIKYMCPKAARPE